MGSRVLRSEIHCVMSDFAVLGILPVLWGHVHVLGFIGVYRVAEALVDRDQTGTSRLGSFISGSGIVAR